MPPKSDKTSFGFNITICFLEDSYFWSKDSSLSTGCKHFEFLRDDRSKVLTESVVSKYGLETTVFSATITDLLPKSQYRARASIFFGSSQGDESDWSSRIGTHAESPPSKIITEILVLNGSDFTSSVLQFSSPLDDGGRSIVGYSVYSRNYNDDFINEWSYHGFYQATTHNEKQTLLVDNLIPYCLYDFKIAAVNDLGEAQPSDSSSLIYCCSKERREDDRYPVLYGRNGSDRIKASFGSNQKVVIIDDRNQMLSTMDDYSTVLEVWTAHLSPKSYVVHGLLNIGESDVAGKIAVVNRGDQPISVKVKRAQRSGAVACIVIDNGKCTAFDQKCIPGSDRNRGQYFAEIDPSKAWCSSFPLIFIPSPQY